MLEDRTHIRQKDNGIFKCYKRENKQHARVKHAEIVEHDNKWRDMIG